LKSFEPYIHYRPLQYHTEEERQLPTFVISESPSQAQELGFAPDLMVKLLVCLFVGWMSVIECCEADMLGIMKEGKLLQ
jgi:hypothetical protein